MVSRRSLLGAGFAAAASVPDALSAQSASARQSAAPTEICSLCGEWAFRLDAGNTGEPARWFAATATDDSWRRVTVPHTWQIEPQGVDHYGVAWYWREFDVPAHWRNLWVRIEFEAVFHSAWVWVNGQPCGSHIGKGYTAFTIDLQQHLRFGERNRIAVKVDNAFSESMLPKGRSSDWAHDGGIYRPVSLLITPPAFVERVAVDAVPSLPDSSAQIAAEVTVRNMAAVPFQGVIECRVVDEDTGLIEKQWQGAPVSLEPGANGVVPVSAVTLPDAKLWHFDRPQMYRLETTLLGSTSAHREETTFGIRTFEVRGDAFYLNGEKIRPMGVERMAGSNPRFGMAEPADWLQHDHRDMLQLNSVFTRVHWPQDKRTLDFCDRHGILIQTEVPTWGPKTFEGTGDVTDPALMQNGLEQLREMIARDRNHPSIFAWGLCNEIGGQNPAAHRFAERMYAEAKALDPRRPRTYASHSLRTTPEKDVSRLMDFISWNEYYESWMGGTPADLRENLERIRAAFPGKPIVVSEYGYCACTEDRPEGDERRIQVLREHSSIFRDFPEVAGLIFFCYNDYRTHVGDRGLGVLKQRVHGVVDLHGHRKASFAALRDESSPIAEMSIKGKPGELAFRLRTRETVPSYPLRGYRLRWCAYGYGNFPAEEHDLELPPLAPGSSFDARLVCETREPVRILLDVLRPTGFSVRTLEWRP